MGAATTIEATDAYHRRAFIRGLIFKAMFAAMIAVLVHTFASTTWSVVVGAILFVGLALPTAIGYFVLGTVDETVVLGDDDAAPSVPPEETIRDVLNAFEPLGVVPEGLTAEHVVVRLEAEGSGARNVAALCRRLMPKNVASLPAYDGIEYEDDYVTLVQDLARATNGAWKPTEVDAKVEDDGTGTLDLVDAGKRQRWHFSEMHGEASERLLHKLVEYIEEHTDLAPCLVPDPDAWTWVLLPKEITRAVRGIPALQSLNSTPPGWGEHPPKLLVEDAELEEWSLDGDGPSERERAITRGQEIAASIRQVFHIDED